MTSRRLALLCSGLLATSLVLAQSPRQITPPDTRTEQAGPLLTNTMPINAYAEVGPADTTAVNGVRDVGVSGSGCPAGYLCGQNITGNTWLYSDLFFTNTTLTPNRTGRVTSETFPPPGGWSSQQTIDIVTWRGTYIDGASNGCNKDTPTHQFRIEFYTDDGTGKPTNCLAPVLTVNKVPEIITRVGIGTINFGGTITADEWEFTMLLPSTVNMASGVFSIASSATDHPGCYFLIEPSLAPEGDSRTWRWYQSPDSCYYLGDSGVGTSTAVDIHYCFGHANPGACCYDCQGVAGCSASNDFICGLQGGRFQAGVACGAMVPLCGSATGACCTDIGGCTLTTCTACLAAKQACCFADNSCSDMTTIDCAQHAGTAKGAGTVCSTPNICNPPPAYCIGDMNCDHTVGFSDINPFVLYLSNFSAWQLAYPGCAAKDGDINCDGTFPSFGDINPFVALLSTNPIPQCPHTCTPPAPGPRTQGPVWGGPGTTCADPNAATYGCCVVVAGTPKEAETNNCVTDTVNAGCNGTPPVFDTLIKSPYVALPATIYGASGTFGPYRDMDWYSYTSVAAQIYTVTVRAEFPPAIFVVHAGSDGICLDNWTTDLPASGLACTDTVLVTHCLPIGKYYFVVAPNTFSGVACGADYKLTVDAATCTPFTLTCTGDHTELSACNNDPNHVDENGGCNKDPNNPENPASFEALTFVAGTPYVVCGTTWANEGARDLDWYRFTSTGRFTLGWDAESEVPLKASIVFDGSTTVNLPPTCTLAYTYTNTIVTPGTVFTFDQPTITYQPGTYYFLAAPQVDSANALWYGYPCDNGNTSHNYKLTFHFAYIVCPDPCTDPAFAPNLQESEPTCGPGIPDVTDGGCDAGPPYHTKPIAALDLNNDYCGGSGSWPDPNDPNKIDYDYDWYEFTTATLGRPFIYLYSDFPSKWEIWPANNCAAGPIEGLEMPACYTTAVKPAQCYSAGTYWLRVAPTDASAVCGTSKYYLAVYNYGGCSVCSINCSGATNNDNPCDDVNDFDTNYGCNKDPNGVYQPTAFLTYAVGGTYCGQSYAKIYPNGNGYYDPDWFKINLPAVTSLRLRVQAQFPAYVALFAAGSNFAAPSCAAFDAGNPVLPATLLVAACSGTTPTNINFPTLAAGVYVGVIYPIDYFGNLLTNYYPCSSGHNQYKIIVTTYIP